ncbi:MAG: 4Fe-4S binding protein, partial [Candidatus Omnitrophica bacterium]|nr:4Fe-4S binding protein [Candidatus Omnitrophota bacterium]
MAKQKKNFSPGSIKIERQKCKGCELCIESCPRGLLTLEKALNKRGVRPVHYKGGICT